MTGRAARGDTDVTALDGQAKEEEGEEADHHPTRAGESDCGGVYCKLKNCKMDGEKTIGVSVK